jgi:hypothetical protein
MYGLLSPLVIQAERWDEFPDWPERPSEFSANFHTVMSTKAPWDLAEVPAKD